MMLWLRALDSLDPRPVAGSRLGLRLRAHRADPNGDVSVLVPPTAASSAIAPVSRSGMLGFVGQVRAPILHHRHLRIGILRMGPVIIRPFLFPFPIDARQGDQAALSIAARFPFSSICSPLSSRLVPA
jgi:hypothetical protein